MVLQHAAWAGDNWLADQHIYVRLLSMAQVFRSPGPLQGNATLAAKASLALHGWLTAATHNVNWWWPDIVRAPSQRLSSQIRCVPSPAATPC